MFYGEFEHVIDAKSRVMIPAKFREIFKERYVERFFITRGLDQCLFVFTEEQWKTEEKKFRDMPLPRPNPELSTGFSSQGLPRLFVTNRGGSHPGLS